MAASGAACVPWAVSARGTWSARRELAATRSVAPSCSNTAIHMGRYPSTAGAGGAQWQVSCGTIPVITAPCMPRQLRTCGRGGHHDAQRGQRDVLDHERSVAPRQAQQEGQPGHGVATAGEETWSSHLRAAQCAEATEGGTLCCET